MPARVGLEIVRSTNSPPDLRTSSIACVKRLGDSIQFVSRENTAPNHSEPVSEEPLEQRDCKIPLDYLGYLGGIVRCGMASYGGSVNPQLAERPESKTREDVVEQQTQQLQERWKRICIDAVLLLVVVFCVAELAIRLLQR